MRCYISFHKAIEKAPRQTILGPWFSYNPGAYAAGVPAVVDATGAVFPAAFFTAFFWLAVSRVAFWDVFLATFCFLTAGFFAGFLVTFLFFVNLVFVNLFFELPFLTLDLTLIDFFAVTFVAAFVVSFPVLIACVRVFVTGFTFSTLSFQLCGFFDGILVFIFAVMRQRCNPSHRAAAKQRSQNSPQNPRTV